MAQLARRPRKQLSRGICFKRAGEFHGRVHEHLRRLPASAITGDYRPLSVIVSTV
jgi:hypothetical protein